MKGNGGREDWVLAAITCFIEAVDLRVWKEVGVKAQIWGKGKHGIMQLESKNATERDFVTTGEG